VLCLSNQDFRALEYDITDLHRIKDFVNSFIIKYCLPEHDGESGDKEINNFYYKSGFISCVVDRFKKDDEEENKDGENDDDDDDDEIFEYADKKVNEMRLKEIKEKKRNERNDFISNLCCDDDDDNYRGYKCDVIDDDYKNNPYFE
jgi:hypothetical protein